MTVNVFTEVITDHKVENYKDKLQGLLKEFQARIDDLQELKPCFTFLVNSFDIDVINDGCLVPSTFRNRRICCRNETNLVARRSDSKKFW